MEQKNKFQDRRDFIKNTPLLSLCAAAGFPLGTDSAAAQSSAPKTGVSKLKLSLNAYSFDPLLMANLKDSNTGMSLMELLDFCALHNFDAIDPTAYYFPGYPKVPGNTYLHDFKRRAFQLGLEISGTGVRNNFAQPDKTKRAADVALVKAWIEAAAWLGAPVIRVFAGAEPEGYTRRQILDWMVEDLRQCAEYGENYGVMVGLQNHGDFLKTADQTLDVVKRVDSEWFGVIVDTGNFWTENPYEDIAQVLPYAVNWQVKERVRKDGDPMDLKRLIQVIRAGGYRGFLPIETLPEKAKTYDPRIAVPEFLGKVQEAIRMVPV